MLLISSEGRVDRVWIIESTLPPFIADHAVEVFEKARFSPGKINDTPVRSRVRIVLTPTQEASLPDEQNSPSLKSR